MREFSEEIGTRVQIFVKSQRVNGKRRVNTVTIGFADLMPGSGHGWGGFVSG